MLPLSVATRVAYAELVQQPTPIEEDDGALARRILSAAPQMDGSAEAELCRRFAPRIRLYGLRHLRSEAAAADLVQEVLLMTLQKLRSGAVREPERVASFILGTCRQVVIDGRRSGVRRERILDTFAMHLSTLAEDTTEVLDGDRLQQCLGRLPERERAVLVMSFYDDRPADAVGTELGLSAGNVRVIRHRGIERLKLCMEAVEEGQ
jgi:RNA polymerase sigma-70 factor (ECF subfamily)